MRRQHNQSILISRDLFRFLMIAETGTPRRTFSPLAISMALLLVLLLIQWWFMSRMIAHFDHHVAVVQIGAVAEYGMAMSPDAPWHAGYFVMILFMWVIMMAAMMTPSILPVLFLYGAFPATSDHASLADESTVGVLRRLSHPVGRCRCRRNLVAIRAAFVRLPVVTDAVG